MYTGNADKFLVISRTNKLTGKKLFLRTSFLEKYSYSMYRSMGPLLHYDDYIDINVIDVMKELGCKPTRFELWLYSYRFELSYIADIEMTCNELNKL